MNIFKRIFTLKRPDKIVSKCGRLVIDKYGFVRPNYDNPEVRAKIERQLTKQAELKGLL